MATEFFLETLEPNLASVGAKITDLAGTQLVARTAATAGASDYEQKVSVALDADVSDGYVVWDADGEHITRERFSVVANAPTDLSEETQEQIDSIYTKTLPLGTATVRMSSPLNTTGTELELVRGDDLYYADGQILEWENSSWNVPADATVLLTVKSGSGVLFAVAGTRVSATKVRVPVITKADTILLPTSSSVLPRFEVKITQSDGHVYRKVLGSVRVLQNVSSN